MAQMGIGPRPSREPRREPPVKKSNSLLLLAIALIGMLLGGIVVTGIAFVVMKGSFGWGRSYSTRNGEKTLAADQGALDTPLRAHRDHPWIKLVKAEIEKPDGTRMPLRFWANGERIELDFESSADFKTHPAMAHFKPIVLLKNEKGDTSEWHYQNLDQLKSKGSWTMTDGNSPFGFPGRPHFPHGPHRFGGFGHGQKFFTPNMEVFVVLDDNYDPKNVRRFKISNSLSIGDKTSITLARDWKDDEVSQIEESVKAKTGLGPAISPHTPAVAGHGTSPRAGHSAPAAMAFPPHDAFGGAAPANIERSGTVGEEGGWKYEFAKDREPVLGLVCSFGQWDGHPSIAQIRPLYKDHSTPQYPQRVFAKPGYAVGGVNIEASPYVSGFQAVFMKLDGKKLVPTDKYTSDWIRAGTAKATDTESYLSEGKLVIGVHGNNGAIVNTMGLIFQ